MSDAGTASAALSSSALAALRASSSDLVEPDGSGARARPRSVEAAVTLLEEARRRRLPIGLGAVTPAGGLRLERGGLDAVGPLDEAAMWLRAGAGASLATVEAQLRARGLTLGSLPPSVLVRGTVASWLEGPHAGRRTEDGRLASAAAAVAAVLPDGTVLRSRAAPRTAAGPGLVGLLLGAGGTTGAVLAATLRARPLPIRTERLAVRGAGAAIARLLQEVSYGLQPPIEVELVARTEGLVAALTFASERDEAERRRTRAELRAGALGLAIVEAPGREAGDEDWEVELPRAAMASALAALPAGARVRLCRIAREAAVAVCGADAAVALCGADGVRLLHAPQPPPPPAESFDDPACRALFGRIVAALRPGEER